MVATAAPPPELSETQLKHIKMSHFYTYDGTWRTTEPSWRVMLGQHENVRGCPSHGMTLNDPTALNSLQPGRRTKPATPSQPPQTAAPEYRAAVAAANFAALNFKDQKLSGFANETLCHTAVQWKDPERWSRLGIMTRERLVSADRFGDISVPGARPFTAPVTVKPKRYAATYPKQASLSANDVPPRPSAAEATGFTRRPLLHSAQMLTGGFVYNEPEPAAAPEADANATVVGNKLLTGYTINNHNYAAEDAMGKTERPELQATHWARTSIGSSGNGSNWYEGVGARVTKYGEVSSSWPRRAPSPPLCPLTCPLTTPCAPVVSVCVQLRRRKLAPHETGGPVNTLRVETSGFTRNMLHQRDHVRENWLAPGLKEPTTERKLQASQIALRMMENPIEYTSPHAHKMRQ